jgi:hypothetical protein
VAGPYLSNKATRIGQPKKLIKCLCRGPYLAINLRGEKHRLEDQAEQLSKPWPPMMLGTSSIFCSRINAGPGNTLNGGPYHPLFLPDSAAVRWFFGSYRKTLILRRLLNTILFCMTLYLTIFGMRLISGRRLDNEVIRGSECRQSSPGTTFGQQQWPV